MRGVELARPRRVVVRHPLDQPRPVGVLEGRAQRQHLVERDAQPVDVAARVGNPPEPLRRHVAQRPQDVAGLGQLLAAFRLGQSEIRDPDDAVAVHQQVRRLDVAVDDAVMVGVGERLGHLKGHPRRLAEILRLRLAGQLRLASRRAPEVRSPAGGASAVTGRRGGGGVGDRAGAGQQFQGEAAGRVGVAPAGGAGRRIAP